VRGGVRGARRHRHVIGDDRHLGFEVDAPGGVAKRRIVART
jgi:hypothetical protein